MSRTTRRRAIRAVAPVAGLLAAGLLVWQGSYAAFSANTSNTQDAWDTGQLALTNNGGTATYSGTTSALFNGLVAGQPENNIKIGSTGTKCITVESTGNIAGALKFYRGAISGTNSAALAPQLSHAPNSIVSIRLMSHSLDRTSTSSPFCHRTPANRADRNRCGDRCLLTLAWV